MGEPRVRPSDARLAIMIDETASATTSPPEGKDRRRPMTLVNLAAALVSLVCLVVILRQLSGLLQPLFVAIFLFYGCI